MVGPGDYAMHVVGEEHGQYVGQGEWGQYSVNVSADGGMGMHGGGAVGGGMFGHGGMQEGF